MKSYRTIEEALKDWHMEQTLSDPRFVFKHAIRLQGLYLHDNNQITNANGRPYATLGEVKWKNESILEAKIKLNTAIDFVITTVDISRLK